MKILLENFKNNIFVMLIYTYSVARNAIVYTPFQGKR